MAIRRIAISSSTFGTDDHRHAADRGCGAALKTRAAQPGHRSTAKLLTGDEARRIAPEIESMFDTLDQSCPD
jgi:hypothetical protein